MERIAFNRERWLASACGFPGFFAFLLEVVESHDEALEDFSCSLKERLRVGILNFADILARVIRGLS
jgi:hypothetical protein